MIETRSKLCTWLSRILYWDVPNWVVYAFVSVLVLAYVSVVTHTPLGIQPDGGHDDEFFMSKGRYLSQGEWLGPFSQFTLMKGPGYPAFLAIASWLGAPISFTHAVFRAAAVTIFVAISHRFIRSALLSGVLFTLLLWHPYSFMLLRILREQIYPSQVLLLLGVVAAAVYLATTLQQRIIFAALGGLLLGWVWLTREEGVWILPGLAVVLAPAVWRAYRESKLREIAMPLTLMLATFVATQISFSAVNWYVYGKYVGVDFKETNFQRALHALHSVRSGGAKPFVAVTQATRQRIYEVSPSFATLRQHFEGAPSDGWRKMTCQFYKDSCGEIGAGWFMWALRDAAAAKGHYVSPKEASAFFGRVAREITEACNNGKLECEPQLIAEMPPYSWAQLRRETPSRLAAAYDLLVNLRPSPQLERSSGTAETLAVDLQFLNYPVHKPSSRMHVPATLYTVRGFYYKSGSDWFSAEVVDGKGLSVDMRMSRYGSPDLAKNKDDPAASFQRFTIETACNEKCLLKLRTSGADEGQVKLGGNRMTPFVLRIGEAEAVIDSITERPNPAYQMLRSQKLALTTREFVLSNYRKAFLPILIPGTVAFLLASILYWRKMLTNVCYVMALASWVLVFSRAGLLILIDSTAMPTLQWLYLSAAYPLLVCAAIFSIAALPQLGCEPQSTTIESKREKVPGRKVSRRGEKAATTGKKRARSNAAGETHRG